MSNNISRSIKNHTLIILLFILLSIVSIYFSHLFNGKIYLGGIDYQFHQNRIEGLSHAILNHHYFPKVNMFFLHGLGYASGIFYFDFILYIPAVMRILGFSIAESFIGLIIILNFLTFISSYYCFYKIDKRISNSLFFSIIYTLSTYRLYNIIGLSDVGQLSAFIFLPVVFLGMYEILLGNDRKWYILSIGMTLLLYVHPLVPIVVVIFILFVLLLFYKQWLFDKERIKHFIYAVLLSILLSMIYLFPMIEQLTSQKFHVMEKPVTFMSDYAMLPSKFFETSFSNQVYSPHIGFSLLIFLFIYLFFYKKISSFAQKKLFLLSLIFIFVVTNLFPWKIFNKTFLNTLQFPWRFMIIISLVLAWLVARDPIGILKKKYVKFSVCSLVVLLSISYGMNSTQDIKQYKTYDYFNHLNSDFIGGGAEYLSVHANSIKVKKAKIKPIYDKKDIKVLDFHKKEDEIMFKFKTSKNNQTITLPLVYYKGYQAELISGEGAIGEARPNVKENGFVSVKVSGKGTMRVYYKETKIQKVSRYISLFSWFILIISMLYFDRNKFRGG